MKLNSKRKNHLKLAFSLVLACALTIMGVGLGKSFTVHAEEPVNNGGTYEISTADQLIWVAENLSEGNLKFTADIEIADAWKGICASGGSFNGNVDGGGKTVTIKGEDGLFVSFGSGEIKDLTVVATIDCRDERKATGAIANLVTGSATIINCTVKGSVYGVQAGGLVGKLAKQASLTIDNSVNEATVWGFAKGGLVGNGGFLGKSLSSEGVEIKNSKNNGLITSSGNSSAGFIGSSEGSGNVTIESCVNNGAIKSYGANTLSTYAGGFIAYTKSPATVKSCLNTADVIGGAHGTGAIIGLVNSSVDITGCVDMGRIDGVKNATGCVGTLGKNGEVLSKDNYSFSKMDTIDTPDEAINSATKIDIITSGQIRLDNYTPESIWLKLSASYNTALAESAGIKFNKIILGYYDDNKVFTEFDVEKNTETKAVDDKTKWTIMVKDITDKFIMKDLIIRLYGECLGNEGYFEKPISLAALGNALAADGYKNTAGEVLEVEHRLIVKDLRAHMKTIVACGDGLTLGSYTSTSNNDKKETGYEHEISWPHYLDEKLGTAYRVLNESSDGKTLTALPAGGLPTYSYEAVWKTALNSYADIAIIALGSTDCDYKIVRKSKTNLDEQIKPYFYENFISMLTDLKNKNEAMKFYFVYPPYQPRLEEDVMEAINGDNRTLVKSAENYAIIRSWLEELIEKANAEGFKVTAIDAMDATNDFDTDTSNIEYSDVSQYYYDDMFYFIDRGQEVLADCIYNALEK